MVTLSIRSSFLITMVWAKTWPNKCGWEALNGNLKNDASSHIWQKSYYQNRLFPWGIATWQLICGWPTWQLVLCLLTTHRLHCSCIVTMEAETESRSTCDCLVDLCCPFYTRLHIPIPKASWNDKKWAESSIKVAGIWEISLLVLGSSTAGFVAADRVAPW